MDTRKESDEKSVVITEAVRASSSASRTDQDSASVVKLQEQEQPQRTAVGNALSYLNPFAVRYIPPIPDRPGVTPEATANRLSKIYFVWMNKLMKTGYARPLVENDIPLVEDRKRSSPMTDRFQANFDARVAKGQRKNVLLTALLDTFPFEVWYSMTARIIVDIIWMTAPQLSRRIIYQVSDAYKAKLNGTQQPPVGHGVGMVIGLALLLLVSCVFQQQFFYYAGLAGSQSRTVLINALYRKSLKLSNRSRIEYTNGRITNLMSTDTYRVEFCCMFVEHLLDAPIPLIICLILLLVNIGVSSLCGFALLVVASPALGNITRVIARRRLRSTVFTDQRIRLIQELLQNMRIIKFFAWENAYIKRLYSIRVKEIKLVRYVLVLRSAIFAISITLPVFASMISFVILSVTGHNLDPAKVFASLSLFNMLRIPLMVIPLGLTTGTDAYVALQRIEKMLMAGELESEVTSDKDLDCAISINNASFVWEAETEEEALAADAKKAADEKNARKKGFFSRRSKAAKAKEAEEEKENQLRRTISAETASLAGIEIDAEAEHEVSHELKPIDEVMDDSEDDEKTEFTGLHNLNLKVKPGELVVITGFIGSGKTSLLAALVGEMRQTGGSVKMGGTVAYCPQPWIQNSTLRENILFGRDFDEEKYANVIKGCALEHDLAVLPAGDQTEIGERGINISGGQKSRITLARAAYYGAEIVLLDDVLSAVDPHVGRHLVEQCICGLLRDSTRLLATHQLHVLPHADRIIFMNGTGGFDVGTYDELLVACPKFAELIQYGSSKNSEEEEEEEEEAPPAAAEKKDADGEKIEEEKEDEVEQKKKGATLMNKEERQSENVSWTVYREYFKAAGGKYVGWAVAPMIVGVAILASGTQILTNLWLSYWTQDKFSLSKGQYIGLFVAFGVICAILYFLLGFSITYAGANASVSMNMTATEKVIQAPMAFFDTSPLGRIMNRFSNDVESMDNTLIDAYRQYLMTMSSICGILILIIAYFHYFAIALAPMIFLYIVATMYYRASAVDIKRMDSNARSAVFSHFSETLTGLTSVRAYNEQSRFSLKMEKALDEMNRFSYLLVGNQRWLSVRLESIAICLVFITGMLAVSAKFNVGAASLGLVLSYCMSLSMQMSMVIKQLADVENFMNAAERIYYYMTNLPSEAAYEIEEAKPRATWPEKGAIEMKEVVLQYRPGLPKVLRGLDLMIEGGQKIGICGRTGAGKSSIMVALYRLAELTGGQVLIDGVDISKIGLHDLRSKLAIIPQDPVLFRGTIRTNLDPFNIYSDAELWDALRRAGLLGDDAAGNLSAAHESENGNGAAAPSSPDAHVNSTKKDGDVASGAAGAGAAAAASPIGKFQLDSPVDDEGLNFSLGERQLLALARALVRNFQILVLDEATSSVDYQTDAKIQEIIVREFAHCTILCIAHRLKTIINYDRILVLDAGKVAEFGAPLELYEREESIFRGLCLKSKITTEDFGSGRR
ncbi:ABC multidrug transporter [Myxozyma melibiosi]|uniref:ABC multidrug transporter n=1 Tax=Myxozyma melibiosi TaxID=54550 RepID=A0ABR1F0K3_9ASCO